MSATAANPICAKCGTEIIVDDGGLVMIKKRFYHNTCAPDYRAAPTPSSPSPDSRRDVLTGIVLDQCKAMQGDDFAALVEGVVRDLAAALKAAEARNVELAAETRLLGDRSVVLEDALKAAEAELKCPIGMDDSRNYCSAGTCKACWGAQAKHYHERAHKAEADLAAVRTDRKIAAQIRIDDFRKIKADLAAARAEREYAVRWANSAVDSVKDECAKEIAATRSENDRLREGLRSTETPLTHASQCLDGIVSMDEEDEGENGGSATCQAVKKVVDRALKHIRALLAGKESDHA